MNVEGRRAQADVVGEVVARREGDEVRPLALRQVPQASPDLVAVTARQAEIDQRNLGAEERRDLDGGRVSGGSGDRMPGLLQIRSEGLELVGIVVDDEHAPGSAGHRNDVAVEAVAGPCQRQSNGELDRKSTRLN